MTDEEMQAAVAEIYIRPGQGPGWAMDILAGLVRKLPGVLEAYILSNDRYDTFVWTVFVELNDDWIEPPQVEHTMRLAARLMAYAMRTIAAFEHLGQPYKRARVVRAWGLVDPLVPPADTEITP